MSKKLLWRGLLGIILMVIMGGCSSVLDAKLVDSGGATTYKGPHLSFYIGDTEFTGSSNSILSTVYRKDITIRELLSSSGVVIFNKDGKSIQSVSRVSLAPEMTWALELDSKVLSYEEWDNVVTPDNRIRILAKSTGSTETNQYVILFVNGAGEQPELTHSYIMPYMEDSSVRSFLISSEWVQLSENNRSVVTVKEYVPLIDQIWRVKVNGKLLLENGMDMKLRPHDEVEIVLNLR